MRPEGVQVEVDGTPVEGTVQLEPGPHEVVVSLGIKARVFSVTVVEGKPNTWCYDFDAAQRISEGPCDG